MIRRLTECLGHAVERRLRDVALGVAVAALVALFSAISLGFGAFAAYGRLRGPLGDVAAALVVCAACGLTAVMIGVVWASARRRKARRAQRAAPPPAVSVTALLQSLTEAGAPQNREVMAAAMRLGREISPMQLLALAIVGGFIVGRKLDK